MGFPLRRDNPIGRVSPLIRFVAEIPDVSPRSDLRGKRKRGLCRGGGKAEDRRPVPSASIPPIEGGCPCVESDPSSPSSSPPPLSAAQSPSPEVDAVRPAPAARRRSGVWPRTSPGSAGRPRSWTAGRSPRRDADRRSWLPVARRGGRPFAENHRSFQALIGVYVSSRPGPAIPPFNYIPATFRYGWMLQTPARRRPVAGELGIPV